MLFSVFTARQRHSFPSQCGHQRPISRHANFLLLRQIKIIGPNFYHEHCTFLYYLAKKKIALEMQNSRMSYLFHNIYDPDSFKHIRKN
ncbi:hypothetical protein P8452_68294 [Trifolium repens]|nr:hypothetical protein P8452_68294 [Trifolium repens]